MSQLTETKEQKIMENLRAELVGFLTKKGFKNIDFGESFTRASGHKLEVIIRVK